MWTILLCDTGTHRNIYDKRTQYKCLNNIQWSSFIFKYEEDEKKTVSATILMTMDTYL